MGSSMNRTVNPPPASNSDVQRNDLWARSARSIVSSAKATHPAAGQTIVSIAGFRMAEQTDEYRLDYICLFDGTAGASFDFQVVTNNGPWFVIPVPAKENVPIGGTVFLQAGDTDVSIQAVAGSGSGVYAALIALTRLKQGFRTG